MVSHQNSRCGVHFLRKKTTHVEFDDWSYCFFGKIPGERWETLSSLSVIKIPKQLRDWLIFIQHSKKSEILPTDNSPRDISTKQTFELKMTSHKMKHVNASLRFSKVMFVCLFKVINVSPPFKTKSAYTFTNKTAQISVKTGKISLKSRS